MVARTSLVKTQRHVGSVQGILDEVIGAIAAAQARLRCESLPALHGGSARCANCIPDDVDQEQDVGLPGRIIAAGQVVVGVEPGVEGIARLGIAHARMKNIGIRHAVGRAGIVNGARVRSILCCHCAFGE